MDLWREQGYRIALWRDGCENPPPKYDFCLIPGPGNGYPGYANAVNYLVRRVMQQDPECEWFVIGGDDVDPDPTNDADDIARSCTQHFGGTFGVMQPTGDRWGEDEPFNRAHWPNAPAYIDRVCGSAWLGREFCRRVYGGHGPLFHGYRHMFVDEELQSVAMNLGIFEQRRDLIQTHHHVHRDGHGEVPAFLKQAYSGAHWKQAKALFDERKAAGFPGHEPIP